MNLVTFLGVLLFIFYSHAHIYFEDRFDGSNIDNWIKSEHEKDVLGSCEFAKPKDACGEVDGGIKTTEDARFYRYSARLSEPFSNANKTMCVQFSVMHEQNIDCGGGYVKLLGQSFEPKKFHGESSYEIMFGPDICGYDKKKVHVIFSYKGQNHLLIKDIPCKSDTLTHLYTLIVRPDNTFEVLIDEESAGTGSLATDFGMLPPKTIDDPDATKPLDWVDDAEIDDLNDVKPADWDQPKTIIDENAAKPVDWDDKSDGDWTAPLVDNPKYKGEWHPNKIPNPLYKGAWIPPQIPNPEYYEDDELYARTFAHVGLDLWQVKSGTIFDNFVMSDDVAECQQHAEHWRGRFRCEKELEASRAAEQAKQPAPDADSHEHEHEHEDEEDVPSAEDGSDSRDEL